MQNLTEDKMIDKWCPVMTDGNSMVRCQGTDCIACTFHSYTFGPDNEHNVPTYVCEMVTRLKQ